MGRIRQAGRGPLSCTWEDASPLYVRHGNDVQALRGGLLHAGAAEVLNSQKKEKKKRKNRKRKKKIEKEKALRSLLFFKFVNIK